jgi:nitrogen fixation/metabolism regulation signal transduction histidine kinase
MALAHDRRNQLAALAGGLPALVLAGLLLLRAPWPAPLRGGLLLAALAAWWAGARLVQRRTLRPLQTLSNLLAALREGDFSFRGKDPRKDDALGSVYLELNTLADLLQQQRVGALEATALLRTVMGEIRVAVLAFDGEGRLRLVNRAGEQALGRPSERLTGSTAAELGLASALEGESPRVLHLDLPGGSGRFELRRTTFRQGGLPHSLLVLSDLTRPLREEERQAWQRLVRVLSHEFNNSLAPIQSLSGSLTSLVRREPPPPDLREDLLAGLEVIASRSGSLQRFLEAYARLAKLPPPSLAPVDLGALVRRVASLEARTAVRVQEGPPVVLQADGDQVQQLLVNLLRNAAEASLETGGGVEISWEASAGTVVVRVADEGPGPPPAANLFVPFFTTKPGGSGIGLALSRQIAEAHGGSLELEPRGEGPGAAAILRLPLEGRA